MSALEAIPPRRRGTELLLRHCHDVSRTSAAQRLSDELGKEMARRLVAALAHHGASRRLRSSSSP